jgi:hypothetical protein
MKRLLVNIALFFVAVILLATVGVYGLLFSIVFSVFHYAKHSFIKFWADTIYAINIGIDQIGNVLLAVFLNRFCLYNAHTYPFGKVKQTISHVLAVNFYACNIKPFGHFIIKILLFFDPDHLNKSIKGAT